MEVPALLRQFFPFYPANLQGQMLCDKQGQVKLLVRQLVFPHAEIVLLLPQHPKFCPETGLVEEEYAKTTELSYDPNVSRNMRGYYAFAWWRYDHAVHPMTAAIILETGFLTNPTDAELLIYSPEVSATGIANGIIRFLASEGLLNE